MSQQQHPAYQASQCKSRPGNSRADSWSGTGANARSLLPIAPQPAQPIECHNELICPEFARVQL